MSGFDFGLGFDLGSSANTGGVVPPVPGLPITPSAATRLSVTDAYDSAGDAALRSALIGSEVTRARPSFTMAANTPRTIGVQIGQAVGADGGWFTWVGNTSTYTAGFAISYDSTNYLDGSWTDIPVSLITPPGGSSTIGYGFKRQGVKIPSGPTAPKVKFTVGGPNATVFDMIMVRALHTDARNDCYLVLGPSLEGYGMRSVDFETEILSQFPALDPACLLYSVGGATSEEIAAWVPTVKAAFGDYFSYVFTGNPLGNVATANGNISNASPANIATWRGQVDAIYNGFPGKIVFPQRMTYRAYDGVSPAAQAGGSLGYNEQIIDPATLADQSFAYKADLKVPFLDLYIPSMRERDKLTDPVHFGPDGIGSDWMRREITRMGIGYVATGGTWGVSYIEKLLAAFEAQPEATLKTELQYYLDAEPSSPAKAALQARLNAPVVPAIQVVNGGFTTDLLGWRPATGGSGSLAWGPSSTIRVTRSGGNAAAYQQLLGLTVGASYRVTLDRRKASGSTTTALAAVRQTSNISGTSIAAQTSTSSTVMELATTLDFVAQANNFLHLMAATAAGTAEFDNVRIDAL